MGALASARIRAGRADTRNGLIAPAIPVVIVGAGNLGKLLYDCLVGDPGWRCTAFLDHDKAGGSWQGVPIVDPDASGAMQGHAAFLAIGYPDVRRRMVERLSHLDLDWRSYVDRRSLVGPGAVLGRGALVLSFAMVASGVAVGDFSYVSSYAHAGTGASIGAYTSLMGGASVGASIVGDGCTVGLKSACLDGAVIGDGAVVAPYTLVRRTVPPGALVAGSPARIIRGDRDRADWARDP